MMYPWLHPWLNIRGGFQHEKMIHKGVIGKLAFTIRLRNQVLCNKTTPFIC